jgi:hypothetical protein
MQTSLEPTLPTLIAPDPACDWCYELMREPTLTGQSLVSPGRGRDAPQRLIAGALHARKYHVHCNVKIGDRDHSAPADIALPCLPMPTVVTYDRERHSAAHLGLTAARIAADQRMHWAEDVAESMKFARVGWRVIRVREPALEATSPLDVVLPRPIVEGRDNDAILRIAVQHVLGILETNVVAA